MQERLFHLRPLFRTRQSLAGGFMDVAPWVDVVLLFILVFIIQSATLKKPGLQVQLPETRIAGTASYDARVLTVVREGVYFFDDERVSWVALADRLRAAVASPETELIIEADGATTHRALTDLYNLAVDAGWKKIVLATRVEAGGGMRP